MLIGGSNMPTASISNLMTPPVTPFPASSEASAIQSEDEAFSEIWCKVLDERLIEWAAHPEEFDEEGMTPPSPETLSLAFQEIVKPFREKGRVPPSQVVPDAHGGIVFERRDNNTFESIRVRADGHIEYCRFNNGKLVDRQMWR